MRTYQMCTRCVMDTTSEEITFDASGVHNYFTFQVRRGEDKIVETIVRG